MKIIIPMTGKSKRFKEVGIDIPKQFLEVSGKKIIDHVIDMFPGEKDINLIVSKEDIKNRNLKDHFESISKYKLTIIDHQISGPGGAVLNSGLLETDEDIIINYCDFSNIWNWGNFKKFVITNKPDGIIPAYRGLHPHSVYKNDYAFLDVEGNKVINIKEKESFTDNKMDEYASTGMYYFKSGNLAKKYIEKTFKLKKFINNEIYISTTYEEMIKDGMNVYLYPIKYFFQWGTPEDYNEFIYNLNEIENIKLNKTIDLNKKINLLIPAAGESSRFRKEGYKSSKIYLDLNGNSIINTIINSFENSLITNVLIQNKDFINNEINETANIKKVNLKTKSQAESAFILVDEINNNFPLLIHSSDCVLDKYTKVEFEEADVVVFTKNNYRRAFENKQQYGWVNSNDGLIKSLSIKSDPLSKSSNVIIGTFLFKNKNIFKDLYLKTIKLNKHLSEIHVDHLVETALKTGLIVQENVSEKSVMLGTPQEYELFQYMKHVFEYLQNK